MKTQQKKNKKISRKMSKIACKVVSTITYNPATKNVTFQFRQDFGTVFEKFFLQMVAATYKKEMLKRKRGQVCDVDADSLILCSERVEMNSCVLASDGRTDCLPLSAFWKRFFFDMLKAVDAERAKSFFRNLKTN